MVQTYIGSLTDLYRFTRGAILRGVLSHVQQLNLQTLINKYLKQYVIDQRL